jgi:O-antigen ligase
MSIKFFGLDFNIILRIFRYLTYYLIFFIVTNMITTERQVQFLTNGLFVIGIFVGGAMMVQALVGDSIVIMPGRVEEAMTIGKSYEALRILPPGQTLMYILFVMTVCLATHVNGFNNNTLNYVTLLATGIGITLTYNRNYWVSSIFCVFLLFLIIKPKIKINIIKTFFILFLCLTLFTSIFVIASGSYKKIELYSTAVSDRFASIFLGKKLYRSGSIEYRKTENKYAFDSIKNNPIIGIGLGNDYRPEVTGLDDKSTYYIHNGYLWILVDMGFAGLWPFLWFYLLAVYRGFKNYKKIQNDKIKGIYIGCVLSATGLLLSNFVSPIFMQWFSIVPLAIIIGLIESIININSKSETSKIE